MSVGLIVRPEAEGDILSAALWYEGREVGLGLELTAEIHAAVELGELQKNFLSFLGGEFWQFFEYLNFAHGSMILSHTKSSNVMGFASTIAGVTIRLIHLLRAQELCQHSLITTLAHR